jgi:uncharacterized protein (DUF488 family)
MRIATIGVFGFTERSFFAALKAAGVTVMCDIRRRRGVRGAHNAFANSSRLQATLQSHGIRYLHLLEFAPSHDVRALQQLADKRNHVTNTRREALDPGYVRAYTRECLSGIDIGELVDHFKLAGETVAFMCVEQDPKACHRSLVARHLARRINVPIIHVLPTGTQKERP